MSELRDSERWDMVQGEQQSLATRADRVYIANCDERADQCNASKGPTLRAARIGNKEHVQGGGADGRFVRTAYSRP